MAASHSLSLLCSRCEKCRSCTASCAASMLHMEHWSVTLSVVDATWLQLHHDLDDAGPNSML